MKPDTLNGVSTNQIPSRGLKLLARIATLNNGSVSTNQIPSRGLKPFIDILDELPQSFHKPNPLTGTETLLMLCTLLVKELFPQTKSPHGD
ncbi:hypothetical protein [Nostoc sp.]|uniref:hypothetical protein n=1 Tax=Nostoc sp. TaxID=1180 RepID=UPI003FA612FD